MPDVRTGLKPVVRKILYDMNTLGLSNKAKPKKAARVV
ncbi:DNA gyrase subunit A, partial [Acinetobacter baumannii]|nr:DNA gyrase subunit A [Acinetobacter baumannii]